MRISKDVMEPMDIAQQQCRRAWSLLRTLASQFSDDTCKFEGKDWMHWKSSIPRWT